jgi:hypothetical protein
MSSIVQEKSKAPSGIDVRGMSHSALSFSHREQVVAVLLFLFSLAYLCIFRRHTSLEPDEGIVLQGAERVLRGQVPYRDLFTFYTPGSFYLVAFLFKLFGDSLVVARTSLAVSGAVCAVITFLLVRRVRSLGIAVFTGSLVTVAGCAYRFLVLHNWYSTLLCCLCLYAAVRLCETQRTIWAFAVGCFAALTFLFEQSKGAGLCFGIVLAFVLLRVTQRVAQLRRAEVIAVGLGFSLPLLITAGYFAEQHSLRVMIQSWLWPLRHYTRANHVPYGWQNWSTDSLNAIFHTGPLWIRAMKILAVSPGLVIPVLPLITVGLLVYWIARIQRAARSDRDAYYVLICSVLSGLFLSVLAVRADVIHFMYLVPLWYIVLGWIVGGVHLQSRIWSVIRPYFIMYVAFAFGLLGFVLLLNATGAHIQIQTRRGSITLSKEDPVLEYLIAHTSPEQNLLVYPYLPLYNYLTATRSPSRYDYFQPGMNTPQQAREIIASLKSADTRTILLEPWFPEKIINSWPGTSTAAIANDPIADYIASDYRVCKILNSSDDSEFEFMVRKHAVCP